MKIPVASIEYVGRSFSVIPIKPRGKEPIMAWKEFQTRRADEQEVRSWFDKWPDANVGTITGEISEMVVIDLDSVEAKDRLKEQAGEYDLNCVPRSRTGKGWQLFFKHPGGKIPNRAGILPGLDLRADGGYVVLPPSVHPNGKIYKWEVPQNGEFPKLPAELFKLITSSVKRQESRERFDTAQALAGVPEGQRDDMVFRLACKLRNADVPQDTAERLILESAGNCQPPFPESTALEKVARAYATYAPKQATPNQSEDWPELISAKDLLTMPADPTRWLWDQCLPVGGCSILVSKPKVGKTTMAVNLSIAVARGIPFLNRETQKSPVAYLSLDASFPEITETFTVLGLRESDPIFIHAGGAPRYTVRWLMQRVKERGVRLIVIDTLQRLFKFRDLNDYSQVTNTMVPLLEEARAQNVHLLITHHAKKDTGDDLDSSIGSTAIRGLAYTYLHLKRLPDSERRIFRSDQRNGKNFPELALVFNREGWLEVFGTRDEAEVEEVKPKILELLEAEGSEVDEKEIRRAIPARGWVVGRAIRELFKAGDLDRTGKGRRGDPYKYMLASSIVDLRDNPSSDCLLQEGIVKGREVSRPILIPYRDEEPPRQSGLETGRGKKALKHKGKY